MVFVLHLRRPHHRNEPKGHLRKVKPYCDGRLLAENGVVHCGRGSSREKELLLHGRGLYSKDGKFCNAFGWGWSSNAATSADDSFFFLLFFSINPAMRRLVISGHFYYKHRKNMK